MRYSDTLFPTVNLNPAELEFRQGDDITKAAWRLEQSDLGVKIEHSLEWVNVARQIGILDPHLSANGDLIPAHPNLQKWRVLTTGLVNVEPQTVVEFQLRSQNNVAFSPIVKAQGAIGGSILSNTGSLLTVAPILNQLGFTAVETGGTLIGRILYRILYVPFVARVFTFAGIPDVQPYIKPYVGKIKL